MTLTPRRDELRRLLLVGNMTSAFRPRRSQIGGAGATSALAGAYAADWNFRQNASLK